MSYLMDLWSFDSASSVSYALIIAAFAVIGAGLKYIDDAFDEEVFSKKIAMLTAPILVILWVCLSIFDSVSATVLFSILFAVLLSGKVDNLIFKLSSIALVAVLFLTQMSHLLLVPLFALTVMGIADEKGNDYVDKHKTLEVWEFFFAYRCSMKVCILGLCTLSLLPWLYMIAFLAFDTAYEFVGGYRYLEVPNFDFKIKKIQFALIILKKFK